MTATTLPYFNACDDAPGKYWTRRRLSEDQIIESAAAILERRMRRGPEITSPQATRDFLAMKLSHHKNEKFGLMFMDNKNRVLKFEILFSGGINSASVYPREIVRRCIELNAAAVILAHNHPSGVTKPSQSANNRMRSRMISMT
jgi:DNA repair protein RadC